MQRKQRKRNEVVIFGIYEDIQNMSRKASGSLAHVIEDSSSEYGRYTAGSASKWMNSDSFEHVTRHVDDLTAVPGGTFSDPHCCSRLCHIMLFQSLLVLWWLCIHDKRCGSGSYFPSPVMLFCGYLVYSSARNDSRHSYGRTSNFLLKVERVPKFSSVCLECHWYVGGTSSQSWTSSLPFDLKGP